MIVSLLPLDVMLLLYVGRNPTWSNLFSSKFLLHCCCNHYLFSQNVFYSKSLNSKEFAPYCHLLNDGFEVIDDPTGNSYVENPNAPSRDEQLVITHYIRSRSQDIETGCLASV